MNIHSIILARGGSKGIPKKNIIDFCGKPLIAWTIEQCLQVNFIDKVWVSSNDKKILDIAKNYGANIIKRPKNISGDYASSEAGWLHAIEYLEKKKVPVDVVFAPQVTSPLRETKDIEGAIEKFKCNSYDSMFSCCAVKDLFIWQQSKKNHIESINYDYLNRKRRQDVPKQFVENGSFYIFTPEVIRKFKNRFGKKIGFSEMALWKMFEIDDIDDMELCSILMKKNLLKKYKS